MAVPMVRQLKRSFPQSHSTVLARTQAMAEVFKRLKEVDQTIVTGKGLKGIAAMVSAARERHPDVYLVPFPSNRWQYSLLAATSGAERKVLHSYPVGYVRAMHFLPATRVKAVRGIHDVVQNLNLLRELGIEPDLNEAPVFPVTESDRVSANSIVGMAGFIAVHAGSAKTVLARAKRWPAENYARLIDAMAKEFQLSVMLLEGPDEMGVADEILKSPRMAMGGLSGVRVVKLTGSLGVAGAVLERAAVYVGSDSGLAHLAAAVGKRTVTLFGPADPDRVSPFGNRDLVVQAPQSCGPCFLYPWQTPYPKVRCHEPYCIDSITVDAVMTKVRLALARTGAGV